MSNEFYNQSGWPQKNAPGDSASADAEFLAIQNGFAKLPALAGLGLRMVRVNSAGTALESVTPLTSGLESYQLLSGIAGTNAITAITQPTFAAYITGQLYRGQAAGANTTGVTINLNSVSVLILRRPDGSALQPSDIPAAGYPMLIWVRAADAVLINPYNEITAPVVAAAAKATLVNGDLIPVVDSAASNVLKTWSFANLVTQLSGLCSSGWNALTATTATTATSSTTQASTDQSTKIATTAFVGSAIRGYLAGFTLSTAGGSTTMSITGGEAQESTRNVCMTLGAYTKTTASWTLGSAGGGLDTGASLGTASTWYYWYVIRRPDTGVVDLIFSLSSSEPTLPANYTQYRYIGAGLLNGSKNWTAFTQMGRDFYWSIPILDVTTIFSGTSAVTATLTIPSGRKVKVFGNANGQQVSYISDLANADLAPSETIAPLGETQAAASEFACWSNTSSQIRYRCSTNGTFYLVTKGWRDLADTNL